MDDAKIDLLPCPFCGGRASISCKIEDERTAYREKVTVTCQTCGASLERYGDTSRGGYADNSKVRSIAVAVWNRRAPMSALIGD